MSITERPVSSALKTMLVNNEPIQYAHLIKFERPSRPDSLSGLVSTAKQRYTYLTDASINVDFDDNSTDLNGTANGTQTYLANKVIKLGTIQESTKAAAANTSLVLDGTGLGASINYNAAITLVSAGIWDIALADPYSLEDVLNQGFREGDKVSINNIDVNINSFRANNVLRVTKVDTNLIVGTFAVSMKLASEEIISILLNKNSDDYASFINREVYIYRAYFKEGTIVGTPILIFRGIIYSVNFEDSDTAIKVTWGLTSHWGDFAQVRGRVTSDSSHRALNESGVPQPQSALKPIYAYDKGFNHSETSIHVLSKYITKVEKMDVKSKKGFLGIGSGVSVRKYYVDQDNFTQLDFELGAKTIPIVYGCRSVDGIPIFGDTLNDDSATVYVVTALSEGEIGAIYDVTIEGSSLICNDKADYDARSTQTADNSVSLICRGRADRGDVLGGQSLIDTPYSFYSLTGEQHSLSAEVTNIISDWYAYDYNSSLYNDALPQYSGSGIIDGETINLTSPQYISIDFFSGKSGQKASAQLSKIAYAKNFKIQNNYWTGTDSSEYWGPNHRLLDTAYVVGMFKIAEGESTIPDIKFTLKGKVIDCYNYDYSYSHDTQASSEDSSNFPLGSYVSLYRSDTNALINSNLQIIDKWTIINPDGTSNVRFRFSSTPSLNPDSNDIPTITKFYMKNVANNTWTMLTHNYVSLSGSIPGSIATAITGVTNSGGYVNFTYASSPYLTYSNDPVDPSAGFQLVSSSLDPISVGDLFKSTILAGSVTSTSLTSGYLYTTWGAEANAVFTGNYLASKTTIRLPGTASAVDSFYNGYQIEVSRYNSSTGKSLVQSATIVGYDGTNKVATIDSIFDFIPTTGDSFLIYPKYRDSRVSTNTPIQLLDYITSKTYGRGLHYTNDLNLPSWLETARKCDTQSDVTILFQTDTTSVSVGDVYSLTLAGVLIWQGTVSNKFNFNSDYYLEFTNCIGKLTNKWNNWKSWKVGDVIYNSSYQFFTVNTAGVIATEPTTSTSAASLIGTLFVNRVSGAGTSILSCNLTKGNPVQSLKNGSKISGYSLYDSDDINYWRLSGWEEHAQRYVTKCQTNLIVDTSSPIFDNINSFLEHMNGMLRYTAGKYYLDVEELATNIELTDIRTITTDDIIGKIQLTDEGTRSSYNSLTAAFADPAIKFEARSISFFNSEYLKADKNVPKKGNISIPGITNYYNTRLLADSYLNKSRYGLTINMTIRTHGILLLAGTVIQVIYPRYDWTSPGKKFRIDTITYQSDGLADIVAKEYDDSFYNLSNLKISSGTGATTIPGASTSIPLNNLTCSTNQYDQITLSWTPDSSVSSLTQFEIWGSDTNTIGSASLLTSVPAVPGTVNTYVEIITYNTSTAPATINRYYWIRKKVPQGTSVSYSSFYPSTTAGVTGTSLTSSSGYTVADLFISAATYNAGTTYSKGDMVYYGSSTWIYTNNTPGAGHTPPVGSFSDSYWDIVGLNTHKYTWIAYANSSDNGVTFTDFSTGGPDTTIRRWMGIATNKDVITPSSTVSDYTWTRIS